MSVNINNFNFMNENLNHREKYNFCVYTPRHIAREIVKNTLDNYFGEKPTIEKLNRIKLCDLACGSGNLIFIAMEELIRLSKKLTGVYSYNEHWINGFDINREAVELAVARGQEILRKYNLKGRINVFCKDALTERSKYNLIVCNPPYLGEKNNKEIFQQIRKTEFGKKYYEAKMDYFYFFIEKAVDLLEKDGIFTYITTDYWLKAEGSKILRNTLREKGQFLIIKDFETSVFKKAIGQHNVIFTWKKSLAKDEEVKITIPNDKFSTVNSLLYDKNNRIILAGEEIRTFNDNIKKLTNFALGDLVNINQGLVTGYDDAFIFEECKVEFEKYLKPFYKNRDVGKYSLSEKNKYWIMYLDGKKKISKSVEKHLMQYYEKLSNRREVIKGIIHWWELQWAREEKIFKEPKILARQRCKNNNFSYSEKEVYGSADMYFITKKTKKIDLLYILGYLNSELFKKWFKYNGKCKGETFEFYSNPLKETPIYYPKKKCEIEYISALVKKQLDHFSPHREDKINEFFFDKLKSYS
ncbi:Eco57I restriction-modification methylase domain-containing protein [Fusobacterium sp. PH5-44]|uniref:Eco57I restriction-modification methylase domain-containing protein n=1 Tax=unclassified Fusobacterium TaxID=2648384 RepID=UPI003D209E39